MIDALADKVAEYRQVVKDLHYATVKFGALIRYRYMSDREFFKAKTDCFTEFRKEEWQFEYNSRFLLRPAMPCAGNSINLLQAFE